MKIEHQQQQEQQQQNPEELELPVSELYTDKINTIESLHVTAKGTQAYQCGKESNSESCVTVTGPNFGHKSECVDDLQLLATNNMATSTDIVGISCDEKKKPLSVLCSVEKFYVNAHDDTGKIPNMIKFHEENSGSSYVKTVLSKTSYGVQIQHSV